MTPDATPEALADTRIVGPRDLPNHLYLFIQGDFIVGRLEADCSVCAWRTGQQRWSGSKMAIYAVEPTASMGCTKRLKRDHIATRQSLVERTEQHGKRN